MSEYETISRRLDAIESLLKRSIKEVNPEWVDADTACKMLNVKPSTLASYRFQRLIEFRKPRPYQYSVASIEKFLSKRTTQTI